MTIRYIVEIEKKENRYAGQLYRHPSGETLPLPDLNLEDTAKIRINGETYRLGELLTANAACRKSALPAAVDERTHLGIGQYLYSQIFGQMSAKEGQRFSVPDQIEVRIVSQDERIALLPWNLLADKGIFLSAAGRSVTVSTNKKQSPCEFPSFPRMLVLAPQPAGFEKTDAEPHLRALTERFGSDPCFASGENLKIARTTEDFSSLLSGFRPHIVYYYGHGIGDIHKAKLAFAFGEKSLRYDVRAEEFVRYLRETENPPLIVYINCCRGTPASRLGIGRLLNDFVPAVIVNRTSARSDVLQSQALHFWESILFRNLSPAYAVSGLYAVTGDIPARAGYLRQITPLLYCSYADWQFPAIPLQKRYERRVPGPGRSSGLEENSRIQRLCEDIREMLKKGSPKILPFIRCSQEEQGFGSFRHGLSAELKKGTADTCIYEIRPEWPSDLHQPHRSFGDMIAEAFAVNRIEDIPARIRSENRESSFRHTLIYVNHPPVRILRMISPKVLKRYLEWCDTVFAPLLDSRQFVLPAVSFIVKDPSEVRKLLRKEVKIEN